MRKAVPHIAKLEGEAQDGGFGHIRIQAQKNRSTTKRGVPTTSQKGQGVEAVNESCPQRPTKNCKL